MDASTIISRARRGVADSANYSDTYGVTDLNLVYHDLIGEIITELDEDYFYDIGTADLIQNQVEYTITDLNGDEINQINSVYVKYNSSDANYTVATRVDPDSLEHSKDWYETSQPYTAPIFFIQDNSVWLYPKPSATVTDGFRIGAIYEPADLTITSTETDIKIPARFHDVMVAGVRKYIFNTLNKPNDEAIWQSKYEELKKAMITKMRNRNQVTMEVSFPNSIFKYM